MFPLQCGEGLQPWQHRRRPPSLALAFASGCGTGVETHRGERSSGPRSTDASTSSPRATAPGRPATPSSSRRSSTTSSLAPRQFGGEPQLGEGNIRFSLNRVPDCVDPVKLQHAIDSPIGNGRLVGASFDYPRYSGPNGVLAERIGSTGSYSPATRPEIFYHGLPPGFYRLIVNLAQNNGATTPFHAVTNFQILPRPATARSRARRAKSPAPRPPPSTELTCAGRG